MANVAGWRDAEIESIGTPRDGSRCRAPPRNIRDIPGLGEWIGPATGGGPTRCEPGGRRDGTLPIRSGR
jgi:hypothetical protein